MMKALILGAAMALVAPHAPADGHAAHETGGPTSPEKMSKAEIAGAIFSDPRMIRQMHGKGDSAYETLDVENFLSKDKQFDSGMYQSGAVRAEIERYGVDEFMYFLKGGVTLTSKDGTVMEIKAGDAVTIPRDWAGVWDTKGYTKIYVIYSPDGPIE